MAEKTNPWAKEGERYVREFDNVRDYKFKDNHTHKIRILPNKDADKPPFFGYVIHWVPQVNSKVGRPVIHAIDTRCVLCEYVSEIWVEINRLKEEEEMTDKSPEVIKLHKMQGEVKGNKKYDMNVLDREDLFVTNKETGENVMTPKRMIANKSVWQPIFDYAKKPNWGSPSDTEKGYDFEIITVGEQERRSYDVMPDRDVKPLKTEEIAAIKKGYDLEKLRRFTSAKDIADFLKNAKPPYNTLFDRLTDEEENEQSTRQTAKTQAEPEEEQQQEPVQEPENHEEVKVQEKTEEKVEAAKEDDDINEYECRGEQDLADEACIDCPVKDDCTKYQPYYRKAKELKIDVSVKRKVEDIIEDVKKTEVKKEEPKKEEGTIVKRKKLPF